MAKTGVVGRLAGSGGGNQFGNDAPAISGHSISDSPDTPLATSVCGRRCLHVLSLQALRALPAGPGLWAQPGLADAPLLGLSACADADCPCGLSLAVLARRDLAGCGRG